MLLSSTKGSLPIQFLVSHVCSVRVLLCACCDLLVLSPHKHVLIVYCICAVTLGNIRETMRFSHLAWRLVGLLPPAPKTIKGHKGDPVRSIEVWQEALAEIFQNYNKILDEGHFVVCSDGKTRNLATLLALWQGDQPEIEAACGLVGVSFVSCSCSAHTYICLADHHFQFSPD